MNAWINDDSLRAIMSPAMLTLPEVVAYSAWIEHTPFAAWIVDAQRPRRIVELGTHNGTSYFTFCQTIAALGLDCEAYAVDTWEGDKHAGRYGEDVFSGVQHRNEKYKAFSTLKRMRFEHAVSDFEDGSVDLLHIDGLHTYDAVRGDFETWRPKLSDRAVVLFHDTQVDRDDFEVRRYWAEVRAGRPSFEFLHGHGLGVLGVGAEQTQLMQSLFAANDDAAATDAIRTAFSTLGRRQFARMQLDQIDQGERRFSRMLRGLALYASRPRQSAALIARYRRGAIHLSD